MKRAVALLAADTHVSERSWSRYRAIAGDSVAAFRQVYAAARRRDLPVVLAGDVFDVNRPDSASVAAVRHAVDSHPFLDTWYVQGQHELATPPWLSLTKARHAANGVFDVGGVRFQGLDFTRRAALPAALATVEDDTQVLVAHQVWAEHMGNYVGTEGKFADIPHASVVVSGDFHGHRTTRLTGASGQPLLAVSPGSTCMQAVDEDPVKYVFVLYDDLSVESVVIPTRPVIRDRLGTDECLRRASAALADLAADAAGRAVAAGLDVAVSRPIWIVDYRDEIDGAAWRLQTAARAADVHLIPRPLTRAAAAPSPPVPAAGETLRECLPLAVEPDDPAFDTAARLLDAASPADELAAVAAEWLGDAAPL